MIFGKRVGFGEARSVRLRLRVEIDTLDCAGFRVALDKNVGHASCPRVSKYPVVVMARKWSAVVVVTTALT